MSAQPSPPGRAVARKNAAGWSGYSGVAVQAELALGDPDRAGCDRCAYLRSHLDATLTHLAAERHRWERVAGLLGAPGGYEAWRDG